MLVQELIRQAVEVRRVEAETSLSQTKRYYNEWQNQAVKSIAELIGSETVDQENPKLIEAINKWQTALTSMEVLVSREQADLDFYKRLTNDSKAMQEFVDRQTGSDERGQNEVMRRKLVMRAKLKK